MSVFRNHTPNRRNIAIVVNDYKAHRSDLKIDYQHRCGYCNDIDIWRCVWFEIDHFIPQKYLITITDTDYSNLVYSCRSCNNAKRGQWPTLDETISHQNNKGFIDPCSQEYNTQFSRFSNGRIRPETKLGEWMYNALKLYKPQHEIIWNIELLDSMIDEIETLLLNDDTNTLLSKKLLDSYREFRKYVKALSDNSF